MLDTDIVSYSVRGRYPRLDWHIANVQNAQLCISSISRAELRVGVLMKPEATSLAQYINEFIDRTTALAFDQMAADCYANVAARLRKYGILIGQNDTYIAAHALSIGATLVTHNVRHFERVEGLSIVDWTV